MLVSSSGGIVFIPRAASLFSPCGHSPLFVLRPVCDVSYGVSRLTAEALFLWVARPTAVVCFLFFLSVLPVV